jgi:O-antigen/teichoic acid export membrane protein
MLDSIRNWVKGYILEERKLSELFKGSSISFLMKIAGLGFAQIFALVIARLLGADAYGIFSLSLSLLTIFSIIATAGLDTGLLRFIASDSAKGNKEGITSNYVSSLIIAIPLSLIATYLSFNYAEFIAVDLFKKPDLTLHFKIVSFGIPAFVLIKLNSQGLRGFKRIKKYTFISFVSRYLFTLILIIPIYYLLLNNNRAVVLSFVVALVIIAGLSLYWILSEINLRLINTCKKRYKSILAISIPLMLAGSLQFVKGWVDTIMLGYFMKNSDVGIYNISLKLAALVGLVLTAVNIIAAPKFAETYGDKNTKELNNIIQDATKLIFWGSLPIFLVLIFFPDLLLSIFGKEFIIGSTSLIILAVGYLINSVAGSVGYVMQMTGKQIAFQNITLITAIIGVTLNYLLIPIWGINGAAISTTIGIVFWNITSAIYLKVRYNLVTYFNPFRAF